VVGDAADGEKEEKETLRTLGVDGMKSLWFCFGGYFCCLSALFWNVV
jgi:hypothetical protein